jgi:hypothetical protein
MQHLRLGISYVALMLLLLISFTTVAVSQASYTAQVRGTVTDGSGAVVPKANVTITDDGTNISKSVETDEEGLYIFTALRPASYTLKVEATGFQTAVQNKVVLAVSQQTTSNFTLKPATAATEVDVVASAPMLDTSSASLGTDVTNEFVSRIPLQNRDVTSLVYLSAGVTSLNNADPGYPYGTNFSSNGQRYASAEIRLDGNLTSGPEQGEGATTNVSYVPSTEVIQEFKVQNNSFSAEFGNNGGTLVNMVLKSGTNTLHGSGWWFGQRKQLNANDFFSNRDGVPREDATRDQYGFSVSGPLIKNRTFFVFDLERVRQNFKSLVSTRVPTALERQGDFRETLGTDRSEEGNGELVPVQIFNPFNLVNGERQPFTVDNVIDPQFIDPIGQALMNAYPEPTGELDLNTLTNFTQGVVNSSPSQQFDIKVDHVLTDKHHLMGRYSQNYADYTQPGFFYNAFTSQTKTRNAVIEHVWTTSPRILVTSRLGVERYHQSNASDGTDPTQFGFSDILVRANGIQRMPNINVDHYEPLNPECCVDTVNGHTQYIYSSAMNWVKGSHILKFGGEQRLFYNNFFQPDYATGLFNFTDIMTEQDPFAVSDTPGSALAALLLGYPESGQINVKYSVANKSKETAFYIADDWKVTPRLTVNLGLRYEWSTPYNERYNRIQFSDFNGDSGISVDLTPRDENGDPIPDLAGFGLGTTSLKGTTGFAGSGMRNVPVDRNNFAPRAGFAFQLAPNTVLRGGAGLFYGVSPATNFQYAGSSYRRDAVFHFSLDGGVTQYATLENLFPDLGPGVVPAPQGTKYGELAQWGFGNANDLGTTEARNPEIYQWNIGVQHLFPWNLVISADYSGNRSTHLPWGGATRSRNIISDATRQTLRAVADARTAADPDNPVSPSEVMFDSVANPFQSLFVGPDAIFDEPDSVYNDDTISLINLLRPYPQFDGSFEALPLLAAQSWYNGLLVRFQKRPSNGLSFEGNYTLSKATDDSSYGANYWIYFDGSGLGNPQDLNNLSAERSVGANDTRHRFALAVVYDLPFGRGRRMGTDMHPILEGVLGGWAVNGLLTLQSGQPIPFAMANSRFTDGLQRPNITCDNPLSGMSLHDIAFSDDPNASYYNDQCFEDPGDEVAGNAPRFSSNARGEGLKNLDFGIFKDFPINERAKLQFRAEFFNFTNSVRFATPFSAKDDDNFGRVTTQSNSPRRTQIAVRFEF